MNATTTTTTTPTNPMQFRTLTAKYAGICRRCNGPIAVGDTIRYGGKGKTYHLATDCAAPSKAPAPQPQAQAAPTPAQLMSAALAATLQQTWTGLLARPARLGDVEPRVVEAPPVEAPAAAETPAVDGHQLIDSGLLVDGPRPWTGRIGVRHAGAGQTPAAARAKAPRKAKASRLVLPAFDPNDAF